MAEALIKKVGGFFTSEDSEHPTYPNLPRRFHFAIREWTLRSAIEADTQDYGGSDKPWELFGTRKAAFDGTEEPLPIHFSRKPVTTVYGPLQMEQRRSLQVIDENGLRPFDGEMHLHIREAEVGSGGVRHWPAWEDKGPDFRKEAVYWELHLPPDQMKWLESQLTLRPDATITLSLQVAAYQHRVETWAAEPWAHQDYAIEPDSWTPIVEANIALINAAEPAPPKAEAVEEDSEQHRSAAPIVAQVPSAALLARLNWMTILIALLVLIVLFK